ncbi:putative two component, sigma54 specific, Fis family transcriptional regulator [Magnetofaba australis IT-1]|uniref:Putative two component, sigma54 specific, Fis family transcriptional regulator n=1 Tax=Magnetofaba australis IT-1 TaxID=1434232 RepID=A0A1Y2K8U3_9PROT|nr:putative two component, sigma54 specific, Fis family transcriptional regulator [Magnetofaba australis IT-1]
MLISGENGSGKEVAARRIHALSQRGDGPFIAVNSAAIPDDHIESALFGHAAEGVGGEDGPQPGLLEQGHQGTLFLDEISDMSLPVQARIMRLLQEQRIERVGGGVIQVDVRVIAATNRDLRQEIEAGRFREDLYYRLNVVPLYVPPLRERLEDIPGLVNHFLRQQAQAGLPERAFSPQALDVLAQYHWPGNVRELKNLVERMVIMSPGRVIDAEHLPEFITPEGAVVNSAKSVSSGECDLWAEVIAIDSLREARERFERAYLQAKMGQNDGNISRTAEAIGMERSALHRKIKSLGLA